MSRHSRRRSRSRSHGRHRHHSQSQSQSPSRNNGRHRSYSRDRSGSRDRDSRRHESRRYTRRRSHSSHSHSRDRSPSSSRSSRSIRRDERKGNSLKSHLDTTSHSMAKATESEQFLLPIKTTTIPKRTFRFDDKGREINEFGEIMETTIIKPAATLTINQKKQQKSQINPYLSTFTLGSGVNVKPRSKGRVVIDPRIRQASRDIRKKKSLNFVKEGTFTRQADEMRMMQARALISQSTTVEVKEDINSTEKKEDVNIPMKDSVNLPPPPHYTVPMMEWWDFDLLPEEISRAIKANEYEEDVHFDMLSLDNCITKEVIEHPIIIERNKLPPPKPLPLMLTKTERKKQRRKLRSEREEEKRIKIQAGMLPKPEAKLTYRNFRQVLGDKAISMPTWADNLVKEQIEKRKLAHQMRNEERKLTPQEQAEKRERKVIGNKTTDLEACLLRIESLSDKKQRFKVSLNATQYHLVGRCLIVPSVRCVMVYVEGTKKALRHYRKLLMKRIVWTERVASETNENVNDDSIVNSCTLLWEGSIKQFHFKEFMMKDCDNDMEARQEMAEKSLVQHWDSVVHYVPEMNRLYYCLLFNHNKEKWVYD